ncbi:MAG TPA: sulfatase-like hydrolase/transferase [Thermoanaerobaculia bacterium]|nr:sulfatase-like hydrolase/transferase [Thermoanaerobaculia bacterium]
MSGRRPPLLGAALLACLAACQGGEPGDGRSAEADPAAAAARAPDLSGADVLLVTIDTLRADALGFAGRQGIATPALDRFAAAGRVFDDAHAHTVTTLPSHANILTGRYPYEHGVRENAGFVLGDQLPTLATLLRDAGYATAAVVGAFPLDSRFGLDRGFDLYDDDYPRGSGSRALHFAERPGHEVVSRGRRWWDQQQGHRFLWVHLYDPHAPYEPPPELARRHPGAPYYGEVEAVDRYLGPLLDPFLQGRERPALVIVTSDHGEALGDHGELTHGLFAYAPTLAVPLLLWHPEIEAGRDGRPAGHVDILPTVLSALGLAAPDGLPGRSLLAPAEPGRRLYFEALATFFNRGWAPLRGLLADGHKLVSLPLPELYDLTADPGEEDNLVDDQRRRYHALLAELPATPEWPPGQRRVSDEEAAQLRSLGYLAASPSTKTRFGPQDDPKNLIEEDRLVHQTVDAYARGELDRALELARELVRRRPDMPLAYEQVVMVLRDRGQNREAIELMERAMALGAADHSLLRQLGLTLAEAGRAQEAIGILSPLAGNVADLEARNALAIAYTDAGRHREAVETLQTVLAADPNDSKALETLGIVHLRMQRPAEAQRYLERALAVDPDLPLSWNTLGVARAMQGDAEEAMAAWERALALDPQLLDALYNLGLTAARVGDTQRARSALVRSLAIAPAASHGEDVAKARRLLEGLG